MHAGDTRSRVGVADRFLMVILKNRGVKRVTGTRAAGHERRIVGQNGAGVEQVVHVEGQFLCQTDRPFTRAGVGRTTTRRDEQLDLTGRFSAHNGRRVRDNPELVRKAMRIRFASDVRSTSRLAEREGFALSHAEPTGEAWSDGRFPEPRRLSRRRRRWRRGRDSNPRNPSGFNGFQDRRLKPLGHLSGGDR